MQGSGECYHHWRKLAYTGLYLRVLTDSGMETVGTPETKVRVTCYLKRIDNKLLEKRLALGSALPQGHRSP